MYELLTDILVELDRLWKALEDVYGKQDTGKHFEFRARIEAAQQSVRPTLPKDARVEPDPLGMDIADPTPDSP